MIQTLKAQPFCVTLFDVHRSTPGLLSWLIAVITFLKHWGNTTAADGSNMEKQDTEILPDELPDIERRSSEAGCCVVLRTLKSTQPLNWDDHTVVLLSSFEVVP